MDYRLQPAGDGTEVTVDADVTLAGAIAQVGRTGLVQETANILVQDFASALEAELAPAAPDAPTAEKPPEPEEKPTEPRPIGAGSVALRALWTWLKGLWRDLLPTGRKG
jgi:hypothetical protein